MEHLWTDQNESSASLGDHLCGTSGLRGVGILCGATEAKHCGCLSCEEDGNPIGPCTRSFCKTANFILTGCVGSGQVGHGVDGSTVDPLLGSLVVAQTPDPHNQDTMTAGILHW